jgi:hypothetical protein
MSSTLNASYKPTPPVNTAHNLKIVYITDFATGTPPANNIFMAYQMAQGSVPGSAILINTPYYVAPDTPKGASMPTFESILKPPVKPVFDASYAMLVGINAPNGLLTYPIQL